MPASGEGWQAKPSFSMRLAKGDAEPPPPRSIPQPREEIREPEPERAPDTPAYSDTSTMPIIIDPPQFVPAPQTGLATLRILTEDELSPEEKRAVQIQMTAFYHAQRLIREERRVDPPDLYSERFFIWKVLFKELLGLLIIVAAIVLLVFVAQQSSGDVQGWSVLVLVVLVLVYGWVAYRMFFAWRHTILYSDVNNTGIKRPLNRWLLLNELNSTVATHRIQTKKPSRGHFASFFNLNSWRVTLDSSSTEDDFLNDLRFVRDGDRLKNTIDAAQAYHDRRSK